MVMPTVLFEDSDVLVINKPAGLIVHSDGRTVEPSVCDWVLQQYPALAQVGEPWTSPQGQVIPRPGIVHRLDRDTSGVMILAKTAEAHAFLKQQFQERTTRKVYLAYVYGWPQDDFGIIEAEIGRTKTLPPRWSALSSAKGNKRNAITHWKVLTRGHVADKKVAVVHAEPKTGRTHQIRVHLQYLGHPVVCDKLYAPKLPCLLGFARQALHARSLAMTVPSGTHQTFEAPLPDDFEHAAALLQS
jgi:23S rRNA pseudouridine1911/1915/1917 synthase